MPRSDALVRTVSPSRDLDHFAAIREREMLRVVLRRDLRNHGGQRTLAREIGIDRTVLRKFVSGQSVPGPSALDRIREFAEDRPEVSIPMAQVGLALLLDGLRPVARPAARKRILAVIAACFRDSGDGVATWVQDKLAGLDTALLASDRPTHAELQLAKIREILEESVSIATPAGSLINER